MAFQQGAFDRAIKNLGDTGESSPQYWAGRYQPHPLGGPDVFLMVHFPAQSCGSSQTERIENFEKQLLAVLFNLDEVNSAQMGSLAQAAWIETSAPLNLNGVEHFGYRDGITAPAYTNKKSDNESDNALPAGIKHELGEVLLGHRRNDGSNPYADLALAYQASANVDLQAQPDAEKYKMFFRNSSFGVLRRMKQNVDLFDNWVRDQAQQLQLSNANSSQSHTDRDAGGQKLHKKWIRAKVMGRTQEGIRLTPKMTVEHMSAELQNALNACIKRKDKNIQKKSGAAVSVFGREAGFHQKSIHPLWAEDGAGEGCPFASHIRRMNPQDDPVTPNIRRPLLRRGLPYIEGTEKGMSGLFLCSDITEHFEHLVGVWAQGPLLGVPDESQCRDPIVGQHEPQANHFYPYSRARQSQGSELKFYQPFVVTRGCAYAWFPTVAVLMELSQYIEPGLGN